MKKLHFLFLLTFTAIICISLNASAQVRPGKGQVSFNKDGAKLGYLSKDNIIKDSQGKKIFFIDANGNAIDAKGNNLGKPQKNGDYYSVNGVTVITSKDMDKQKCALLDPKGHNFGTDHQNAKLHNCAMHCLYLENKKAKEEK